MNEIMVNRDVLVAILMDVVKLSYDVKAIGSAILYEEIIEAEDIALKMSGTFDDLRKLGCLNIPEFLGESLEDLKAEFGGANV